MKRILRKIYWWIILTFMWLATAIVYIPVCYVLAAILAAISYPFNRSFKDVFENILYEAYIITPKRVYSLEFIERVKEYMEKF